MLEKKEVITGKIVKVDKNKGYGFIVSKDRRFIRFFFHWTGLETTTKNFADIEPGEIVQFTEAYGDRGPRAIQIRIINEPDEPSEKSIGENVVDAVTK